LTSAPIFPLAGSLLSGFAHAHVHTPFASHTHARIKSLTCHFESPNRACNTRAPLQLGNETSRLCSLGAWPPTCDVAAITIVVHIITIVVHNIYIARSPLQFIQLQSTAQLRGIDTRRKTNAASRVSRLIQRGRKLVNHGDSRLQQEEARRRVGDELHVLYSHLRRMLRYNVTTLQRYNMTPLQ